MSEAGLIERIKAKIDAFRKEVESYFETQPRESSSEDVARNLETYVLLLGGISSFRRLPGVHEHMGFEGEYLCKTVEDGEALRGFLAEVYGLESGENLAEDLFTLFHAHAEFSDFLSFWMGEPSFDSSTLLEEELMVFEDSKSFAEKFRDEVGPGGFAAWDVGERIGMLRAMRACELIDSDLFWRALHEEGMQATQIFDSWVSYIVSSLWGSVYFMFISAGRVETPEIEDFFDLNLSLARRLVFEDQLWRPNTWIQSRHKLLAIDPDSMVNYLENWEGPEGCLASDRILVDGYGVGFMFHGEPSSSDDSGWRFFAGDEDPEFMEGIDNFGFVPLNWICNFDPEIVPFLAHSGEVSLVRDNQGIWRQLGDVDDNGNWLGLPKRDEPYYVQEDVEEYYDEEDVEDVDEYGESDEADSESGDEGEEHSEERGDEVDVKDDEDLEPVG